MAHPKKLSIGPNGRLLSMGLYDISGSASFNNLCDLGIIIEHIDEGKVTAVNVQKVRYRGEIGNLGTAYLWYNHSTGRYGEVLRTQDENDVTKYRYTFRETDKRNMLPKEGRQQSIDFDSAEPNGAGSGDECPF